MGKNRIRVFIDYWNFQLTLNEQEAAFRKVEDIRMKIDWRRLGPWLAENACEAIAIDPADMRSKNVQLAIGA